jgi:hypothetical protein
MVRKNVAEILTDHVTFELQAIDRMYLNAYVPSLQTGAGFVYFAKTQLGVRVPSTVMVAPMSEQFVTAFARFVETTGIDLVTFEKGQRKDDVAKEYLATFDGDEGVLFVGKAQEKASVFRTEKRRDAPRRPDPHRKSETAAAPGVPPGSVLHPAEACRSRSARENETGRACRAARRRRNRSIASFERRRVPLSA